MDHHALDTALEYRTGRRSRNRIRARQMTQPLYGCPPACHPGPRTAGVVFYPQDGGQVRNRPGRLQGPGLRRHPPVSYTHLDVYKRQVPQGGVAGLPPDDQQPHGAAGRLRSPRNAEIRRQRDVYKRQGLPVIEINLLPLVWMNGTILRISSVSPE